MATNWFQIIEDWNRHKDEKPFRCNELTNASPQIRNKIKKFECSICSKMFRFKDIMQLQKDDHKNVHGGKPFYCELCGLDFQMEEDLNITQVWSFGKHDKNSWNYLTSIIFWQIFKNSWHSNLFLYHFKNSWTHCTSMIFWQTW